MKFSKTENKMEKKINFKRKNKKAMSISIVLLLVGMFILIGICYTYFNIRDKDLKDSINVPSVIDWTYADETQINFHIQEIFNKASQDFRPEYGKDVFIKNFKNELQNYKKSAGYVIPELYQVENQTTPENIELSSGRLALNLKIFTIRYDSKSQIHVEYDYQKTFEKIYQSDSLGGKIIT